MRRVRIVILAKAPIPGFAKTRLISALGAEGAAALAARMLDYIITQALGAGVDVVELCVTPEIEHPAWEMMSKRAGVVWTNQGEGDLGQRLARATRRSIKAGDRVLLIGTDCPELDSNRLSEAAEALRRDDCVIVPSMDGGYVLLGLNRYDCSLFKNIMWSTETVALETRRRIDRLRWRLTVLPTLHDIDEPEDLIWLPANCHVRNPLDDRDRMRPSSISCSALHSITSRKR